MASVARLLAFVVVATCLVAFAPPVPSNDGPPPANVPSPGSYACYPACVLPQSIMAADLNVDGWLDLAVACATGPVWFYANQGKGNPGVFNVPPTPPTPPLPPPTGTISLPPSPAQLVRGQFLAYTPVNKTPALGFDGYPDVAVLDGLTGNVNGTPGWPGAIPLPLNSNANVTTPPPAFPLAFALLAAGTQALDIAGGDFDNDGRTDFVVSTAAPDLRVYLFTLGGYILVWQQPLAANQVAIADFDGNGWSDFAVSTGPAVALFLNNAPLNAGAVDFVQQPSVGPILFGNPPVDMETGDFNADGLADLVVVGNVQIKNLTQGVAEVLLNNLSIGGQVAFNGAPFVPQGPMWTWGFQSADVEVLDADRNGRDDFAVANKGSDSVTVFLTDAQDLMEDLRPWREDWCLCREQLKRDLLTIKFKLFKIEVQCGHFPVSLTAGDFDHNGKIDLAVALESATEKLDAQKPSCIEIIFDVACGFTSLQPPHNSVQPKPTGEMNYCPSCGQCPEEIPSAGEPKKG